MKVLLIATEIQKEEFLSHAVQAGIEIDWRLELPSGNSPADADILIDLLYNEQPDRFGSLLKTSVSLILINSVAKKIPDSSQAVVRFNGWNGFLGRPVIEAAETGNNTRVIAEEYLLKLNRTIEWAPDIAGLIAPRLIASVIHEAYLVAQESTGTVEDIDTAMKLGTNYPFGPFEWAELIGHKKIILLLREMNNGGSFTLPSLLLEKEFN